jgi:hypothetical protein
MKKLFSIALSLLMLVSCFAFSVSAAGEGVNVASAEKGATYIYETDVAFLGANTDDALTVLNDGVVPTAEVAGQIVSYSGTGAQVYVIFDLGALYTDITDINFLCVCDSKTDNGGNRGFSGEDTKFRVSSNGVDFERVKDFSMERVQNDDYAATFYNFNFKFDAPITASQIKIEMSNANVYVLSVGEIEIISTSGEGTVVEEPSVEETTEEVTEEAGSEEAASEETESTEASAEATSKEESKETTSKDNTSKDKTSKAPTSSSASEDEGGINPAIIVVIIVAVIAVAVVVVIIMKKRQ